MIKLTTRPNQELLLNPAQIQSVKNLARERGAEIVMIGGQRHEVWETVGQVHERIEALRDV